MSPLWYTILFSGYTEIFVKEMAHRLLTFFQSGTVPEILPEGYTHTFLIRHPCKYIGSLYKAFEGFEDDLQGKCRKALTTLIAQ